MRKRIFGRRLKRDKDQRKALFRSLMQSLVLYGKIRTTEAKAKSIKGEIEKLVTFARNKRENARNLIMARLSDERAVEKMISEIAPKFETRPGGYTRLVKMAPRLKDGAKMVLMTWVEEIAPTSFKEPKRKDLRPKTEDLRKTGSAPKKSPATSKRSENK